MSETKKVIVKKVQLNYPFFGLKIWVKDVDDLFFQQFSKPRPIELPINAVKEEQRQPAQQALDELMDALGLELPELAKHQPAQVVAAAYARLLNTVAYDGGLFTSKPNAVKVLEVTEEHGISETHHKKFTNYHFKATNKMIDHDVFDKFNSVTFQEWRLIPKLEDNIRKVPADKLPKDFLLWFDENKQDRGDYQDMRWVQYITSLQGDKLLFAFYQVKFELADVLTFSDFHDHVTSNLPAGIFIDKPAVGRRDCLSGILMCYQHRPSVADIYHKSVEGKLPNKEWNGQWEN